MNVYENILFVFTLNGNLLIMCKRTACATQSCFSYVTSPAGLPTCV